MKTCVTFLAFIMLFVPVQARETVKAIDVSLIQLIANPKDYDGKIVRVTGFLSLETEGNAIWLHQDDYRYAVCKNGLWIDVTDEIVKKATEFDQKYVILQGTFNAKAKRGGGIPPVVAGCRASHPPESDHITRRFRRGLDPFQLFPTRVEFCEVFLRGSQVGVELVGLRGMCAVKIRRGEQAFNAGDLGVRGVDLRFHAFQFARFLER